MRSSGGYAPIEELLDGKEVTLVGEGVLTPQPEQSETPPGPGRFRFRLRYSPEEGIDPHTRAIRMSLEALDAEGEQILRWKPGTGLAPLPRYDLVGTAKVPTRDLQVRLESVVIEYRNPASTHAFFEADYCRKVRVGDDVNARIPRARAILPNLGIPRIEIQGTGLRAQLEPVVADPEPLLLDPDNCGKALPTCLLSVEMFENVEKGLDAVEALDVFGWFLSFYVGRAVHPSAWEGEAKTESHWGLNAHTVTLPPIQERRTCLPRSSEALQAFLERAWERWVTFDQKKQGRLKGVINLYHRMLWATFPLEQLALTAMYLERFRDLVLGNETVLDKINAEHEKIDPDKVAKLLRGTLGALPDLLVDLREEDRKMLRQAVGAISGGNVQGLFRPTFAKSLRELYERAHLPVEKGELRDFINERNAVIHGSWDPSARGTRQTYQFAEYGMHLLEMLTLRFFGYDGEYYDRTSGEVAQFDHAEPEW
jgi:hypothetical protein